MRQGGGSKRLAAAVFPRVAKKMARKLRSANMQMHVAIAAHRD
jgi:hypothetical protein